MLLSRAVCYRTVSYETRAHGLILFSPGTRLELALTEGTHTQQRYVMAVHTHTHHTNVYTHITHSCIETYTDTLVLNKEICDTHTYRTSRHTHMHMPAK